MKTTPIAAIEAIVNIERLPPKMKHQKFDQSQRKNKKKLTEKRIMLLKAIIYDTISDKT